MAGREIPMKTKIASTVFISLISSQISSACSLATSEGFYPNSERWERRPGPRQLNNNTVGDYWEKIPAPIIKVTKIVRGTASVGDSCDDAGILYLEVTLPKESTYTLEEFGIYFRVKNGNDPYAIFDDAPVGLTAIDGKATVSLAWLDGHPKKQQAIDIEVEAFFVSNGLNIGPSTMFRVVSGAGKG